MNKLKTTFSAGVDFNWDDLAWLQDATRDAFYGLLSAFGIDPDESFILSGCVVTLGPTSASTTAGYISLNGEILKVEAHSIAYDGSSPVVWRLSETDDATGTEQDSTGATVQCYQKRVAVLFQALSYTSEMPYNADNLLERINGEWTSVTPSTTFISGSSLSIGGGTFYYKIMGKTMLISFDLTITMDASILQIDIETATGKTIAKAMAGSIISDKGAKLWRSFIASPYEDVIVISEYNTGAMEAFSNGKLYGQMIIEID
jgi:hypothetical protein